eukprot:11223215-Lingulodinium_polyedra.AAC.1
MVAVRLRGFLRSGCRPITGAPRGVRGRRNGPPSALPVQRVAPEQCAVEVGGMVEEAGQVRVAACALAQGVPEAIPSS